MSLKSGSNTLIRPQQVDMNPFLHTLLVLDLLIAKATPPTTTIIDAIGVSYEALAKAVSSVIGDYGHAHPQCRNHTGACMCYTNFGECIETIRNSATPEECNTAKRLLQQRKKMKRPTITDLATTILVEYIFKVCDYTKFLADLKHISADSGYGVFKRFCDHNAVPCVEQMPAPREHPVVSDSDGLLVSPLLNSVYMTSERRVEVHCDDAASQPILYLDLRDSGKRSQSLRSCDEYVNIELNMRTATCKNNKAILILFAEILTIILSAIRRGLIVRIFCRAGFHRTGVVSGALLMYTQQVAASDVNGLLAAKREGAGAFFQHKLMLEVLDDAISDGSFEALLQQQQ